MSRIFRMRDLHRDRMYQRIWAGIAWGGTKSGCLVVVAEEASHDLNPMLYVLSEFVAEGIADLLSKAIELTAEFSVSDWYGRISDKVVMAFLNQWNSQQIDRNRSTFTLTPAPHSENGLIGYGVQILLQKLKPENNRIVFPKDSTLDSRLQSLPATEVHTARDTDYPAIAALSFVVSALDLYEYCWGQDRQTQKCVTDYDLFSHQ